jgi:D-psicose/D-tagatose/L-ribulose 3-epimerase
VVVNAQTVRASLLASAVATSIRGLRASILATQREPTGVSAVCPGYSYETHQIRTVAEGLAFLAEVGADNLKLLPDAYHMNIEERDPAAALRRAGDKLGLYHAADSNREGIGGGHTDFLAQIAALSDIGYEGPVILETSAPGPNPFSTDKGEGFRAIIEKQLKDSADWLRTARA